MITIFVSSTFKDMQAERDTLQQTVAPALNAAAAKYGKSVSFSDLRWGVNTLDLDSEKGARKVLDVCLDEIDRCQPPMIVILGYRYGWIPSEETLKNSVERKKLLLDDLNMSVTALEIEYGAMCKDPKRTLFYFREIDNDAPQRFLGEDEEHIKKLSELKRRIENLSGRNLRTYHMRWNGEKLEGIENFAKLVEEDVLKLLQPEWERDKALTPFERERNTQWAFVSEKASAFRAKLPLLDQLVQRVQSGAQKLFIKGAAGMGKSTTFSSLAVRLKEAGYDVLPFIGGYTLESNTALDILKNTVYYVEDKLSLDHFAETLGESNGVGQKQPTVKDWRNRLDEVCTLYAKTGVKFIIMLDAADQLNADDNRDNLIFIPYNLSDNVRFIMTCIDDFPVLGECITLSPLDREDRKEIIKGILSPINKELDDNVVEEIVSKKGAGSPLYISLLVQRLLLLRADDFEKMTDPLTISAHQRAILSSCPDELDEMSAALFKEAGTHVNGRLIQRCMEYIAATRHGLRVCDLAALLKGEWNYLDFIHFVYYMNDCFMVRDDGRYDFTHRSLRSGLVKTGDKGLIYRQLADYFLTLPATDEVRVNELGYHLIKDNRYGEFVACVNSSGEDRQLRNALSCDLFEQSLLDEGQWVLTILQSGQALGVGVEFCLFIGEEVILRFDWGSRELKIIEDIMLADIALLEDLNNVSKELLQVADDVSLQDVSESNESMAEYTDMLNGALGELFNQGIFEGVEGLEGLTAEDLLIGMDELKEVAAQAGGVKSLLEQSSTALAYAETIEGDRADVNALSSCYRILSNIYSACGDLERLNKAVDIRERSILLNQALLMRDEDDVVTSLLLCTDYTAIAKLYSEVGTADFYAKAEQAAEAATRLAGALNERFMGTAMQGLGAMTLSESLAVIADLKGSTPELNPDTAKERIALYNQALESLSTMEDGADKSAECADVYKKLAMAHRMLSVTDLRDKHNAKAAYDYYLKSIAIYERLYKEKPQPETLEALAGVYRNIACDYSADGNYKKSIYYYRKVVELREVLHEKLNSDATAFGIASACSELAGVYLDSGENNSYARALEANRQYLDIVLQLERKNNTVSSRQRVSAGYEALASTYKAIGGEDNLYLAYDLYKKRKELERRLEIETGVLCDENGYCIYFSALTEVAEELGNPPQLLEDLIKMGEEDIAFYSKECEKENAAAPLACVLKSVADVYALSKNPNYRQREIELYEQAAEYAVDFYSCYSAKIGIVRALAQSGNDEDGLKAIAVCKEIIDMADLENNADEIKSDELSCLWIMDSADEMAKLLERFQPKKSKEIEYYKALAEEYRQAMFDVSEIFDDDDDGDDDF